MQLQNGQMPLYKLNLGVVTLLPKKEDVDRIKQYKPICLLNISFTVFTKVRTNRVTAIVVRPSQSNFIHGRLIMDGIKF
jgi:hypothetical protein